MPDMNKQIEALIKQKLPQADVSVSGSEGKYQATIISQQFDGLSTLERHQMVYATINNEIKSGVIHALSIVTKTPDEN